HFLLSRQRVKLSVENIIAWNEWVLCWRSNHIDIGQRPSDVGVSFSSKVCAWITSFFFLLVSVVKQLHKVVDRSLIPLLLEVRPRLFVHRHTVEWWLLILDAVVVGADRTIETVRSAARIKLIKVIIAELPP